MSATKIENQSLKQENKEPNEEPKNEFHNWQQIFHSTDLNYHLGRKGYTIIKTNIQDRESKEFKKIFKWCECNVKNQAWSVAQFEDYGYYVTWRFYSKDIVEKFENRFSEYIL